MLALEFGVNGSGEPRHRVVQVDVGVRVVSSLQLGDELVEDGMKRLVGRDHLAAVADVVAIVGRLCAIDVQEVVERNDTDSVQRRQQHLQLRVLLGSEAQVTNEALGEVRHIRGRGSVLRNAHEQGEARRDMSGPTERQAAECCRSCSRVIGRPRLPSASDY